jgi:hypothetical protein
MKKISIYRPTTIEEAIQILSQHGTEAGVYAGGTDLGNQAVSIALTNAAPLKYNAMKIEMAKGLLASGLAKLSANA